MEGEFSLPNVDTEWSFSLSHSETKLNVFVISLMPGVLHTGSDSIEDMINAPYRKKIAHTRNEVPACSCQVYVVRRTDRGNCSSGE